MKIESLYAFKSTLSVVLSAAIRCNQLLSWATQKSKNRNNHLNLSIPRNCYSLYLTDIELVMIII